MRFWFKRRGKSDPSQSSARRRSRTGGKGSSSPKRESGPPGHDPIRDWESPEQRFLREAGDPFLDG